MLTEAEGEALEGMVQGLIDRYGNAHVNPPQVLYVDRDCCSQGGMMGKFRASWPDLQVRLDIWHFLRRIASAVNTEAHPLYAPFMQDLSRAIYMFDRGDVEALRSAKQSEAEEKQVKQKHSVKIFRNTAFLRTSLCFI